MATRKRKNAQQSKGKAALKTTGRALKGAARGVLAAGSQILGAGAKALNPKRKNKTIIKKAKKVIVKTCNPRKGKKATGPIIKARAKVAKKTRRRNLDHKDSTHQIEVSRHWRAGGLSQWQRAHHAGQQGLFAHGIKVRAKHNPTASAKDSTQWEKLWRAYVKALADLDKPIKGANARAAQMRLSKAEKAIAKFDPDAYRRLIVGAKNPNASRAIRKRKATAARGLSSAGRKTRSTKRVAKTGKGSARKTRRNPSASKIRKEFAGRHEKDSKLYFPNGTPQGLAKLGKLVLIKTDSGTIQLVNKKGQVWLCADTKKRLHLGSTVNAPLIDGPARNFGKVRTVEYQESKPHLGYHMRVIWFHHMGEKGGRRPELISNSKGELRFKGGDYTITTRGIEN